MSISEVFVINLDKDTDRMKNIDTNFKRYGIKYTRVSGVYGKLLSESVINNVTTSKCRNYLCNKSIIGSGLSHLKVLEIISKRRAGFYMVCEDDINFTETTTKYLHEIMISVIGKQNEPIMISLNACNSYQYSWGDALLQSTNWICGISCYIITPEAARRFVDYVHNVKLNQYFDIQLSFCNCGVQIYYTKIPIVYDSDFGGHLSSNNMSSYSIPLLQFILDIILPSNWSSVINFRLNITLLCFQMKHCISIGQLLLLLCCVLNMYIGSYWFTNYLALEICMLIFSNLFFS